ncbi:hypothetical protein V2W45_1239302, partial [Cenococcum geophilum]
IKLAAAGFHRTFGKGKDRVECAFCSVQIYDWDGIDCPIEELMLDHVDDCSWPELRADFW